MESPKPLDPVKTVEVEVLPSPTAAGADSPLLRFLAVILDDLFLVPGTKIRIGLDPVLGLFPGFGDTTTNLVSAVALLEVAKRGLPRIVLARMALNILVNALGGGIPVVGDLFSVWFKSNRRNYELLTKHLHAGGQPVSTKGDWWFVIALVTVLVAVVLLIAGATFLLFIQMVGMLGRLIGG